MSEEEQESVEQEVAQGLAPATETEGAAEKQTATPTAKRSDDQDRNWREARRKMQELERKAREQEEIIQRLTQPKAVVDDELDKLGRDDIITYGQVDKLIEKKAERIAEKVIKQREASMVDERLQIKYSDFAQVVTQENIEYLKENEPELAMSLSHISDPYSQGVAAYKMLKKLVKSEDLKEDAQVQRDKEKAVKNSQKPVSVQAVAKQSAIGNAHLFENGLTKDLKKQLWQEMQQAMKGA
jgi:hypothetical protein